MCIINQIAALNVSPKLSLSEWTYEKSPVNPIRDWFFPRLNESSAGMNSALFYSTVFLGVFQGQERKEQLLTNRARSLSSIRLSLCDPSRALGEDTIIGISYIIGSETYLGESKAATAHVNGLLRLIRAKGGFSQIYRDKSMCANFLTLEMLL